MYQADTIAAVATPPGEGGVAVVRLSGPDALSIGGKILGCKDDGWESHRLYYGRVRDPVRGSVVDEVMFVFLQEPKSYTGEDTVEIHCHGGPYVVRQVLGLVLAYGARHAEPGEFTKRAFLNGRLDLAQAEAVLDLIRSRTDKAANVALGQMEGGLSEEVQHLREQLVDTLVQVEAAIDFPEEEIELLQRAELARKVAGVVDRISALIGSYEWGRLIREGVRVCIVGRPNVGKSSLLNALLGVDRAIVTDTPGTTRDFIEETVNLSGLPVVLWDTAGLRENTEGVEQIGIDVTLQRLAESQGCLLVLDGSSPLTGEDRKVMERLRQSQGLVVINKIDLRQRIDRAAVSGLLPRLRQMEVSALSNEGLDALRTALRDCFLDSTEEPEIVVTNVRHKAALDRARTSLVEVRRAMDEGLPPDIVAVDLQEARDSLAEIIGTVTNDDILDRIFSQFCIGK
ncbi:MAG: tRNA uridine-5-carboxymethylaminomethyl(34) synthesis GTPase MnmE [Deltaproteobacteria bacterium]|nr:tRNA uridine-5-carboxymethylaminomethyl(34) synthesis GTPase MnmE [Deltaproteobacteria bacterium]